MLPFFRIIFSNPSSMAIWRSRTMLINSSSSGGTGPKRSVISAVKASIRAAFFMLSNSR